MAQGAGRAQARSHCGTSVGGSHPGFGRDAPTPGQNPPVWTSRNTGLLISEHCQSPCGVRCSDHRKGESRRRPSSGEGGERGPLCSPGMPAPGPPERVGPQPQLRGLTPGPLTAGGPRPAQPPGRPAGQQGGPPGEEELLWGSPRGLRPPPRHARPPGRTRPRCCMATTWPAGQMKPEPIVCS